MEYRGIQRKREPWVKWVMLALAVLMIGYSAMRGQWVYVLILALVMLACFFEKEHIISEAGVNIRYRMFGRSLDNIWGWDEITTIHFDRKKAKPNVMLHIGKDLTTRLFTVTVNDCAGVIRLASAKNPNIYIKDISE